MAEKKFDYNNVATVYNSMKSINEDIKVLFTDVDKEVQNKVNVCDEAIFGDLGNQLLLSWDNISSNFPEFVDNFENWSALVAKASGDYSQFESDVAAFKNANPLGVTSGGATQGAVSTSSYNMCLTQQEIERLDVASMFYEPTGATYIDTGMVEFAKKNKVYNIVSDALTLVSIAASGVAIFKAFKAAAPVVSAAASSANGTATTAANATAMNMASKSAGGFAAQNLGRAVGGGKFLNSGAVNAVVKGTQNAAMTTAWYGKFAGSYVVAFGKGTVGNSAFWNSIVSGASTASVAGGTAAAGGFLSNLSYKLGSSYDASKYGSGYDKARINTGSTYSINSKDYVFVGSTGKGTNVFSDDTGKIYYLDGTEMKAATATDANGKSVDANFDTIGAEFTMNFGNETITQDNALNPCIDEGVDEYFDTISGAINVNTIEREG